MSNDKRPPTPPSPAPSRDPGRTSRDDSGGRKQYNDNTISENRPAPPRPKR